MFYYFKYVRLSCIVNNYDFLSFYFVVYWNYDFRNFNF